MKEFEGVLQHNPQIRNLDAVVGFLRASGYFSLRPFLDNIEKVRVLIGIVKIARLLDVTVDELLISKIGL